MSSDRLGPLDAFVGAWTGEGEGIFPTIPTFGYHEDVTFTDGGVKPFLEYSQRTSALDDGRPLHTESGFLRWATRSPEWIIASPTGLTEVLVGTVESVEGGVDVHLRSTTVSLSPTAKLVESVERILRVRGDVLAYELHMAAVGEPHQLHLTATLYRIR
jgi:hypothetical protein